MADIIWTLFPVWEINLQACTLGILTEVIRHTWDLYPDHVGDLYISIAHHVKPQREARCNTVEEQPLHSKMFNNIIGLYFCCQPVSCLFRKLEWCGNPAPAFSSYQFPLFIYFLCGMSRNQLTSTVNGENPGSRPRLSMHTSWMTPQSDNRALLSLDNSGLSWTVSAPDKVTAVPVRRNGNLQTPISVPAVRPKWCHTLSNPAHRQDCTVACLNYTLQTMMPLPGWPVMAPNAYNNNNNSGRLQHTWVVGIQIYSKGELKMKLLEVNVYFSPIAWLLDSRGVNYCTIVMPMIHSYTQLPLCYRYRVLHI